MASFDLDVMRELAADTSPGEVVRFLLADEGFQNIFLDRTHPQNAAAIKFMAELQGEEARESLVGDPEALRLRRWRELPSGTDARQERELLQVDEEFQKKFLDKKHPQHLDAKGYMEALLEREGAAP